MKSQVSFFIVMGLIAVFIISISVIKFKPEIINTTDDSKKVTESMTNCLNEIAFNGIETMGKQGRIYPNTYLATDDIKISYFYFKGKNYMPSIEEYELELESYINENIYECIKKQKYSIETSKLPETSVEFNGEIKIDVDFPLVIRSSAGESNINEFQTIIDFNFTGIRSQVEEVIIKTLENPDWIYLDEVSKDQNVKLIRVDESTIIYVLKREGEFPFEYRYAVKYL